MAQQVGIDERLSNAAFAGWAVREITGVGRAPDIASALRRRNAGLDEAGRGELVSELTAAMASSDKNADTLQLAGVSAWLSERVRELFPTTAGTDATARIEAASAIASMTHHAVNSYREKGTRANDPNGIRLLSGGAQALHAAQTLLDGISPEEFAIQSGDSSVFLISGHVPLARTNALVSSLAEDIADRWHEGAERLNQALGESGLSVQLPTSPPGPAPEFSI